MRVNIVVARGDIEWICGRMARELAARLPTFGISASINGEPGDLEYQQVVYGPPLTRPAIGLFTHGRERPYQFGKDYDGAVCMNRTMLQYLNEAGAIIPQVIEQPVDSVFNKTPVFGVAGRVYGDGRKGEFLVAKMVAAGYRVIAWGQGWPCEIVSSDVAFLPAFYSMIDYYVDTSSDEGGCTPALEAMASGKPVISHTIGVDRPVLAYMRHDWPSLERLLISLTSPRTYDQWAADHAEYFRRVLMVKGIAA
jgi:hypothetical protein